MTERTWNQNAVDVVYRFHDRIDALGGDQRTMSSWMPGLAPRLPPTLHPPAPHALLTGEAVGRRRFRCDSGILLSKRQLALEVGDPSRLSWA